MWSKWVKTFVFAVIAFLALTLFSTKAFAVPANGKMQEFKQPDGKKFFAALHGDEWFNWVETRSGDIIEQGDDGYWYYGEYIGGKIQATSAKYLIDTRPERAMTKSGMDEIVKDKSAVLPYSGSLKIQPNITAGLLKDKLANKSLKTSKPLGADYTEPMMVILINYDGEDPLSEDDNTELLFPASEYSKLFFNENSNSVNKFYSDVSDGIFQFAPISEDEGTPDDGIITVNIPMEHPDPGADTEYNNIWPVINAAIQQASDYVDFSQYDSDDDGYIERNELHTVFVSAGYEYAAGPVFGPSIWAHSWALQDNYKNCGIDFRCLSDGVYVCTYDEVGGIHNGGYTIQGEIQVDHMMTMGTVTHELGHDLGLPDLYDYGYDSQGVGMHSLMASGSWAAAPRGYSGSSPTYIDGFCRWLLDFADTEVVDAKGKYNVKSILSGADAPDLLIVPSANEDEAFFVENRQYKGFDVSLKNYTMSGGIMIEHVDYGWYLFVEKYGDEYDIRLNDDQNHKGVDIEEANEGKLGYSQLDNNISEDCVLYDHYYYIGGNTNFTSKTIPGSRLYDGSNGADFTITSKSADVMSVNVTNVVDLVPPEIKSITPNMVLTPYGSPRVNTTLASAPKSIQVKFSEPVFPNNAGEDNTYGNLGWIYISDIDHAVVIPAELTIKADTVTLNLQKPLTPGVNYRLRVAGESLKDQYGNILPMRYLYSDAQGDWYTRFYDYFFNIKDKTAPSVIEASIENKATGVSLDQELVFDFGEDISEGSVWTKPLTMTGLCGKVKTTVALKPSLDLFNEHCLILTPVDGNGDPITLSPNTKYTLTIPADLVRDDAGNKSKSYTITFTTEDTQAPGVAKYTTRNTSLGTSVTVTFDENVYVADGALVSFRDDNGNIIAASLRVVNNILYVTPVEKMGKGVKYTLVIEGGAVKDASGNLFESIYNIEL